MQPLGITMEQIFSDYHVMEAIEHLKTKKNSSGPDGIPLHDIEDYWIYNKTSILTSLFEGNYYPGVTEERYLLKPNGTKRTISSICSLDRLLLRVLAQVIQPYMEPDFSSHSYAYQNGKGITKAIEDAADFIQQGNIYVAEIDIQNFFDEIPHERLFHLLENLFIDKRICNLIMRYVSYSYQTNHKILIKEKGISQGSSLSPLLSNLYLDSFDKELEECRYNFCRFADNINIYCTSIDEASTQYAKTTKLLLQYDLPLNTKKSGVYSVFNRKYLGHSFSKKGTSIIVEKYNWKKQTIYSHWHRDSIQKIGKDFHIINDGILTKKDFTLLFENEEKRCQIPLEAIDAINIYSNVIFSDSIFNQLSHYGIHINLYDKYGNHLGSYIPVNQRNQTKVWIKQVSIYNNPSERLFYAKKIIMAAIHNIRCNLRYYQKYRKPGQLSQEINKISSIIKEMNEAKDISQLLLLEARARRIYYQCFNIIIEKSDFTFTIRTKRPPKDPLNALISFSNTILYQKISHAIHQTSLDIRISFLHSSLKRSENLHLDLAELFKPVIADRTIFTLINKKMLLPGQHFEASENGGIYLNKLGKSILIKEIERKCDQKLMINGISRTYLFLFQEEARKLEQSLLYATPYKPYKYQM